MRRSDIIAAACASAGLDLEARCRDGSMWLFGSRAAGCEHPGSDWDLLIVQPASRVRGRERIGNVDLVTVTTWGAAHDRFLGSELAAHVARYGQLLIGNDEWSDEVDVGSATRRKLARTSERVVAVSRAWENLLARDQRKWAIAVRREIQRALALADIRTVPPTFFLDQEWSCLGVRERTRTIARLDFCIARELLVAMTDADEYASK